MHKIGEVENKKTSDSVGNKCAKNCRKWASLVPFVDDIVTV